jgi:2-(1,2-epoxy-1,2-dihydrophenyl)acetyl-CoA isomerase
MSTVLYEVVDTVATVTLNRPESLNAMNVELLDGLVESLLRVEEDQSVRVAVLTGAGRGFCSGADLSQQWDAPPPQANEAVRILDRLPVPTIARVQGVAAGGGFGLALACDVTIAARSAFFVSTFGPRLGIVPDLGATWNLPRRIGRARALGVTLLGGRVTAEQAADWGLIWSAVDDQELDKGVAVLADTFKRCSPDAMTRIRSSIDSASTNSFDEQLEVEWRHAQVLIPRNMAEGAAAFLEKRDPHFDGQRTSTS